MYFIDHFFFLRKIRGGNPKRTIAKIDKNELDIDSYKKNIDKSIDVARIDQNVLSLVKSVVKFNCILDPKRTFSMQKNYN
jgi:hypothetical protein